MAPEGVDTRATGIDGELPDGIVPEDHAPLLKDLQGNILRGHGRGHVVLVLWRVRPGREREMKALLRAFVETSVASAWDEEVSFQDRVIARNNRSKKELQRDVFANIFLSKCGYEALGIIQIPGDPRFHRGMKGSGVKLNDLHCTTWDSFYRQAIHGMILLAHDELEPLKVQHDRIQEMLEGIADVEFERGDVKRNGEGDFIEHFGFADARSQPLFFKSDLDREAQKAGAIDRSHATGYDPRASLNLVLARDPGSTEAHAHGSYLVYRKLMQDVSKYQEKRKELARALEPFGDPGMMDALLVGRFPDGKPLILSEPGATDGIISNNFNYKKDPNGKVSPLHSHIRKMNPRSASYKERLRRIVRRGITYDYSEMPSEKNPPAKGGRDSRVGLLFLCFQADIGRQFEYLQEAANDAEKGLDPILGQVREGHVPPPQKWHRSWDSDPNAAPRFHGFHGCVTLKGGEYFFAPSLGFFRKIETMGKPCLPWRSRDVFPHDKHGEVRPTMGDSNGDPSTASSSNPAAPAPEQDPGSGGSP